MITTPQKFNVGDRVRYRTLDGCLGVIRTDEGSDCYGVKLDEFDKLVKSHANEMKLCPDRKVARMQEYDECVQLLVDRGFASDDAMAIFKTVTMNAIAQLIEQGDVIPIEHGTLHAVTP